jgi:integrase
MTVLDPCRLCRGARVGPGLGLTPYELRHTAASLAVSAGANVKSVQRMLGHASAASAAHDADQRCQILDLALYVVGKVSPLSLRPRRL